MSTTAASDAKSRAESEVAIPSRGGHDLTGTLYQPAERQRRGAVLIAPAMGVRRQFYARFARFLSQQGFAALSIDYRGTGGSRSSGPQSSTLALHDWGEQDLADAIDWMIDFGGGARIAVVAHSVSAQLLGIADKAEGLDAAILIAPQSGYWRLFDGVTQLAVAAAWHVGVPLLAASFGRLPGWALGGMDVPAGVAREWARWGRHPDYILSYRQDTRERFARMTAPLLIYSISDDRLAPPRAVEAISGWYRGSRREHRVLSPEHVGDRIGHFGFFKERFASTAWPEICEWLDRVPAKS